MDSPSLQHIHLRRKALHELIGRGVHLTSHPPPLSQIRKLARPKRKGPVMTAEPFVYFSETSGSPEEEELAGLRICPRLQPIEVDAAREVRTIELH